MRRKVQLNYKLRVMKPTFSTFNKITNPAHQIPVNNRESKNEKMALDVVILDIHQIVVDL